MDAVIAGLVGSFGGVIVGAFAQAVHANRQRRWQVADLDRAEAKDRKNRLWEDRRALYAGTLTAMDELVEVINRSLVLESAEARSEAMDALPDRLHGLSRRVSELRMVSESDRVMGAAVTFLRAATDYSPTAALNGPGTSRLAMWAEIQATTTNAFHVFHSAARQELGFAVPLPTPSSPQSNSANVS
ncbi:hypothetical protein ACGFN1_32780 [Streptomyces sp. NPDC048685]|uniref:hypothetical protein n=1 Tax=Streptomyces sp. NPDC048685 TaxID=3365584 RepID=UPI00371FC9DC